MFGDLTFPENLASRQAESVASGNGDARPVIRDHRTAPLRRVSDPEGRPVHDVHLSPAA